MRLRVKVALATFLVGLFVGSGATAAQAAYRYLGAPIYKQEQSNWCWAASSKIVTQYKTGASATQCQFVKWGKATSTCSNVVGSLSTDVGRALLYGGVVHTGYVDSYAISYSSVVNQINLNRPVIIRWGWNGTANGHMVVARGYDTATSGISYVNPLETVYKMNSYGWMVGDGYHTWTHTRRDIY